MSNNIEQELLKQGLLKTISYAEQNAYSLLRDSYFGSGGYLSGSYLQKSTSETETDYTKRKSLSNYRNEMKPVVDALNDPIFSHDIVRTCKGSCELFEAFEDNADSSNESLTNVIQDIDLKAEILGSVFCFMDNYQDIPSVQSVAIEENKYPYIYYIEPDKITSYAFNDLGALIFVKYKNGSNAQGDSFQSFYTIDNIWYTCESNGSGARGEEIECPAPLLYKNAKKYDKNLLPLSSHMDTATSCKMIFNQNSLINRQQFTSTFNMLAVKGTKGDMKIGPDRVMFVNKETDFPQFISPDVSTMDTIGKDRDEIQDEISKVNNLAVQNSNIAQSGDSKRWNDKKRQEKLSSKVKNVLQLEEWVYQSFMFFSEVEFSVNAIYDESFDFFTISEDLDDIIKMNEAGFTIETLNEARATFTGKMFNQSDAKKTKKLVDNELANKATINPNVEIIDKIIDEE